MTDTRDYASLFLSDAPMIDTRAPVEFARGSFPTAVSLPLMTDDERARVGTCYKQKGQDAAIALGHQLVGGPIKQARIDAWLNFTRQHPNGFLFCFRGGLRSQICQQWLQEAGCHYPRIDGGYKAMRRFLLNTLEAESVSRRFVILSGYTGSAKTELLQRLANSIDLEGLAHHRGSAFGKRPGGQPPQISFENRIAIGLLKQAHRFPGEVTVLEDESRLIGQRYLPPVLLDSMNRAPVVVLESTLDERVEHTFENYILNALYERQQVYGEEQGFERFCDYLQQSLYNIRRRLGGTRYSELKALLEEAIAQHRLDNPTRHREWIEILLRDYYDPMYAYQLEKKRDRVAFSGNQTDVMDYFEKGMLNENLV